jgi:SET domain-containing protein
LRGFIGSFAVQVFNELKDCMCFSEFVRVQESEIHGRGIFTTADIPCGKNIMVIKGEVISEEECIRREENENNVYIFWNEINYIDVNNTDVIKYINHKCDCNCEVDEGDESSLKLIASRDIKIGEELTIDYGYDEIYEYCQCQYCI